MGFVAGFTGGVTLTLSLTYLALLTHNQNRTAQSTLLRSQASTLDCLLPPSDHPRRRNTSTVLPDGTYRPRESLGEYQDTSAASRPVSSFFETAKGKWNAEVLGAAKWAQNKDWGAVRERGEEGVARLLGLELSKEPVVVEEEQEVVREVREVRRRVPAPVQLSESSVNVDEALRELREKTVEALEEVREKTVEAARGAREEARKVVSKGAEEGKEVVAKGVEGAKEAKGVVSKRVEEAKGMVAKGMEKAHDFAGRAKAAIYLAEEKAESRMDAKLLHISDVERTLQERYDSALREQRLKRSVDEVLQERYLPVEKRDNSRLRGL